MKKDSENLIALASKSFAVRCIRLYQFLTNNKKEFVMCKQLLRSGTSIGANVKEALRGQSKADLGAEMNIASNELVNQNTDLNSYLKLTIFLKIALTV